jgi:hypothetical protein
VIVRPELKNNNIALRIDLCDGNDILVNPVEIQKVILNFLNNAIQAIVSIEGSNRQLPSARLFILIYCGSALLIMAWLFSIIAKITYLNCSIVRKKVQWTSVCGCVSTLSQGITVSYGMKHQRGRCYFRNGATSGSLETG